MRLFVRKTRTREKYLAKNPCEPLSIKYRSESSYIQYNGSLKFSVYPHTSINILRAYLKSFTIILVAIKLFDCCIEITF